MKVGYPCVNRGIGCTASSTFRLASYSDDRLLHTLQNNLGCLKKILDFNLSHRLLFFRISSDTVPFASHPVCRFDWKTRFRPELKKLGNFTKAHGMRISMHPDQFVLINALKKDVVANSIRELEYHAVLMDGMGLGTTAKIQIHVGGTYGNKRDSIKRFVERYRSLDKALQKRLVVENDDRLYSLADCLGINKETGIPVLFDIFHHECLNNGEHIREALEQAAATWKKRDGLPMVDYSAQKKGHRKGTHAESLPTARFRRFLKESQGLDFDLMLEIKDKEKSALKVLRLIREF